MPRLSFRRSASGLLLACACLPFSPVFAVPTDVTLAPVLVSAMADELGSRRDASSPLVVAGPAEIERFADATAGELIKRLPGVVLGGPPSEAKDVRLRGLDKEYTQVLVDGQRVPDVGEKREFNVDKIPAAMIERIEIVRAGRADLNGEGVAGTINIVLKKIPPKPHASFTLNGNHLEGTDKDGLGGSLTVGGGSQGFGYLLSGSQQRRYAQKDKTKLSYNAAGAVTGGEREDEFKQIDETLLNPRLSWQLSAQDSLELSPLYMRQEEDKAKTKYKLNASQAVSGREVELEDLDGETFGGSLRWSRKFQGGGFSLETGLVRAEEDKDKSKQEYNSAGVAGKLTQEDEAKTDREINTVLKGYKALGDHQLLQAGVEFLDKDRRKDKQALENGVLKTGVKDVYTLAEERWSVFLMDELSWGATGLNLGARLEKTDFEGESGTGFRRADSSSMVLPSAHLTQGLGDELQLRASVAKTLRRPKFDDLIPFVESKGGSLNNPDSVGNPELVPEEAWGYELGLNWFAGKGSVLGFNLFYRDIQEVMQSVTSLNTANNRYESRFENVGDGALWGAELDGSYKLQPWGGRELTLRGNASWLDSEFKDKATGRKARFKEQPDYVLNAGFDYQLPARFKLGANYNLTGAVDNTEYKADGKYTVNDQDERKFLDLYLSRDLGKHYRLRFAASNLLKAEKAKQASEYNANGALSKRDVEVERSQPLYTVSFEGHF